MGDLTKSRILIYNADSFLHVAKERKIVSKIKDTSIKEIKEVRKADENLNSIIFGKRSNELNIANQAHPYSDILASQAYQTAFINSATLSPIISNANLAAFKSLEIPFMNSAVADIISGKSYRANGLLANYFKPQFNNLSGFTATTVSDYIKESNKLTASSAEFEGELKEDPDNLENDSAKID